MYIIISCEYTLTYVQKIESSFYLCPLAAIMFDVTNILRIDIHILNSACPHIHMHGKV